MKRLLDVLVAAIVLVLTAPLLAVLAKTAEMQKAAADLATAKLEAIDPAAAATSNGSAGSSPASPASTPAP